MPVVDLWMAFMKRTGCGTLHLGREMLPGSRDAPEDTMLRSLLSDGLHLSRAGSKVLYDEIMSVIEKACPRTAARQIALRFAKME